MFISERKQLGTLYHFTKVTSIKSILGENAFKGSEIGTWNYERDFQFFKKDEKFFKEKGITHLYFFSTTRNKLFYKRPSHGVGGMTARIILDGDKLSSKYRSVPFRYYDDEPKSEGSDESEERIILGLKKEIPNAKNYIKEIHIMLDVIEDNEAYLQEAEKLQNYDPSLIKLYYKEKEITLEDYKNNILPTIEPYREEEIDEDDGSFEYRGGPILHEDKSLNELFEKDLPNIEKLSSTEYLVSNEDDIEAKYYFRLVVPEDKAWSVSWKFTDNNKNITPEAWKQITATSYKIIADFLEKFKPTSLHISGNSDSKTNVYKRYADKLQTILNNEYRIDNSNEDEVVLRSIEESAKFSIKKRMETLNESYEQALNYWKNGDIFSKSKSERNSTLKKYNSRKQLSELYNIPFKINILLESFTPQKAPLMGKFVDYTCDRLNIDKPKISIINSPSYSQEYHSFGGYIPSEQSIKVVVHNRNMADILRTLAHELVHHMQNINGDELNGEDGSNIENEANAMAGVIMREFGRENPEIFE
jgi:hypothetical protein